VESFSGSRQFLFQLQREGEQCREDIPRQAKALQLGGASAREYFAEKED
jgi:hypothetical protein